MRLLALDLGARRVGLAVCDERRVTTRPLPALARTNWKKLLLAVRGLVAEFAAAGLVVGLPLNLDGTEGDAAHEARRLARNFELSLQIPVFLQDERLTSQEAAELLDIHGPATEEQRRQIDSLAASLILRDFLARNQ
jgi:putative Holliday junction resolvase